MKSTGGWCRGRAEARSAGNCPKLLVSAARYRNLEGVDQDRPEIRVVREAWPDWMRKRVLVAPVEENGVICGGLQYNSDLGIVFTE